jgi:tripartite-type tricarboxylate transporter receptor subunit TctC
MQASTDTQARHHHSRGRRSRIALVVLLLAGAWQARPGDAQAQDYPIREIRMVNGYSAGAGADVVSRIFAKHLEEALGKPVIVENKPGAFTNIAAAAVSHAKPDGYTVFFAGHSAIATNIHLFKSLPFDPVKDFIAVAPGGKIGFGFAVGAQSPVRSMADLTAYLKAKGDKASYASANAFSLASTELYKFITGAPGVAVPYKNSGDAINDLVRGEVDFMVYDLGTLAQQEEGGRLRVLAVSTAERSAIHSHVPGMREAGIPDFDLSAWFGLWLPANSPPEAVAQLSRAMNKIWDNDEKRRALATMSVEPFTASPAEFTQFEIKEMEKWGKVISIARIEPQ